MMEEKKMSRENGQNITVHLTEEQINKRVAEIISNRGFEIDKEFSKLYL